MTTDGFGTAATAGPVDTREALEHAHRHEWARVVAATVRLTRDLDLAEECTQDAYARALDVWPRTGVPDRLGGWLTTVARNRATDLMRRESAFRRIMPQLVTDSLVPGPEPGEGPPDVADDRLRLIFTCCHSALSREAQVALTLRLLGGLSTSEVARAFLVQEATMAARITRAKKKIAAARIPYRVPDGDELPERLGSVLDVVHLVLTTGHSAPVGERLLRQDLIDRALDLARMLHELMPDDPDVAGLLALVLLVDSRRETRESEDGALVLLRDQDRARWDRGKIDEGVTLLLRSLRSRSPSRFALQAAIAAAHAEAPSWEDTDWEEIVGLYDALLRLWPSPVVALNRAVAVGERQGPTAGLAALQPLMDEPALATYRYLSAVRADFLRQLGRWLEASAAYEEAIALSDNDVERAFLTGRLREVQSQVG